jgi:WD40 repeat protein
MPRSSGRSRAAAGTPGVGVRRALEWNHRAIKCVAFDPGLQKLAGGGLDGTVTLWDAVGGKLLRASGALVYAFARQSGSVASVAFPTGQMLASGADDGTENLWSTTDGKLLRTFHGPRGEVVSVTFDPTGHILARASADGTVILWDILDGTVPRLFEKHFSRFRVSALSQTDVCWPSAVSTIP